MRFPPATHRHLWATAPFDEVVPLGYDRSYPTFARQLRERQLRPHCGACRGVLGRDTIEIDHPPGEECQWDWFERRRAPGGGTAYVQLGTLPCSGRTRGVLAESLDQGLQGVACRRMIEALIDGERDAEVLADMALTRMRPKIPDLREALVGRLDEHHALMARLHLDHIDELSRLEVRLDDEVDRLMIPFAEAATRLSSIPGIGKRVAEIIVAEIGVDMSRFATAAHLASWAGLCPGHDESAGKRRSGKARKGDAALRTALCEAAWAASHCKDGYLPAQYRRFLRRFGKKNENKRPSPSPTR